MAYYDFFRKSPNCAVIVLIGALMFEFSAHLNTTFGGREGFVFVGVCMMAGSVVCFLLPRASRHRSNYEVIQRALHQQRCV